MMMGGKKTIPEKSTVVVDFDGTLCEETGDYIIHTLVPIKNNINKLIRLKERKCHIIVYTARPWTDYRNLKDWLDIYQVPYNLIVMGKVRGDYYLDVTSIRPEEI